MDGNSFFSFDFLLSRINPLLSWALHASFYAKHHIKEEQRMGRALRMRDEGRKLVCQDQHSARSAFPQYAILDFQRHQRKLSTLPVPYSFPCLQGPQTHSTAKSLMKEHRQESTRLAEGQSGHLEIIELLFSLFTSVTNKHTLVT